jgi:hypothetical protein
MAATWAFADSIPGIDSSLLGDFAKKPGNQRTDLIPPGGIIEVYHTFDPMSKAQDSVGGGRGHSQLLTTDCKITTGRPRAAR